MKINSLMSNDPKKLNKVKNEKNQAKLLGYAKWFFLLHSLLYLLIAYILPIAYPEDCKNPSILYDVKCYLAYGLYLKILIFILNNISFFKSF